MQNENYESKAMHCILLSAILFMNKNTGISTSISSISTIISTSNYVVLYLQSIDIEIFDVKKQQRPMTSIPLKNYWLELILFHKKSVASYVEVGFWKSRKLHQFVQLVVLIVS